MDLMEIRRGLMVGMASTKGKLYAGSFTPHETGNFVFQSFGTSLTKYVVVIEMTDESKAQLLQSGNTNPRTYAMTGTYPLPQIIDPMPPINETTTYRVTPSTQVVASATGNTLQMTDTEVSCLVGTSNSTLYVGYTYNFVIVSLA